MPIYHYTKTSVFVEKILKSKKLRTSSLGDMNDPREMLPWTFGSTNLPLEELFPGYYNKDSHVDCHYKFCKLMKDRLGIVCFSGAKSEGWNNEMMWAHYALNHTGVCLEFDEAILANTIYELHPNISFRIEDVNYDELEDEPWITWQRSLTHEQNFENNINRLYRDIAFRKSHFWRKEDERRLVFLNIKDRIEIPIEASLKAIYLGVNFQHAYLPAIECQIENPDVKIYDLIYQNYKFENWPRERQSRRIPIDRRYSSLL